MQLERMGQDAVIEWLLEGDPAIRWQVLRDLLDAPAGEWEAERARTVEEGWVAELLSRQGDNGEWPKGRAFKRAETQAIAFMLVHRLYRSDKTGEVITERFTHLTHPWHWHYTVLRALDYLQLTHAIHDERLDDPIRLLLEQRRPNGRWPLQKRIPGTLLVEMEKLGGESRWNTLRALRVLRRRDVGNC
jgi:hypothetical protein